MQHPGGRVGTLRDPPGDRFQGRQRHVRGGWVAERDVIELDVRRGAAAVDGAGQPGRPRLLRNQRLEVKHLKYPVEADQRRHDLHLHVAQLPDRPVQPGKQRAQRHQGAELEGAMDDQAATKPVDDRRGQHGQQRQGDEECLPIHRGHHADIPDPRGPVGELFRLLHRPAEEFHEHGAGHIEPLGHHRAHRRVQLHPFPG